jgi:aminopeptidase-like protein
MSSDDLMLSYDLNNIGKQMYELIVELYPICRSITGNGFRESLNIIKKHIPLIMHEVPTGTEVFDWVVPKEWNIRDAYVKNANGEKVIDFQSSNLHMVNYSVPVHTKISLKELKEHLHSIPEYPDLIPYKTSYYKENWGFCLPHRKMQSLEEAEYEVFIDSSLEQGSLTYGEVYIKGETSDEILISCHCCHPSLCNDNLSGMALATYLASEIISQPKLRYSYRFLFIPGTIGSITWLSRNEDKIQRIKHGMVVACVGDPGISTYKKSRRGDAEIDRSVMHVLKHSGQAYEIIDFSPYGYDERQYCSPGFNLPVGSLSRTPHGRYPEYHTSADDLNFVKPEFLVDSLLKYLAVIYVLENNRTYLNTNPKCEPQLGKRGLFGMLGGRKEADIFELAMLWTLNLSDGCHSLLDIADHSGLKFEVIKTVADMLLNQNLLQECEKFSPG